MVSSISGRLRAGAGGIDITPKESIGMRGFGDHPDKSLSQGVYKKLYLKALVLDDGKKRAAILGADLLGWPIYLVEQIRKHLKKSCGLHAGEIFLNASHAHCGPNIWGKPDPYIESVLEKTVGLVEDCFASTEEAKMYFGRGSCDMACNRRRLDRNGYAYWGVNIFGQVDHDTPVLKVARRDGSIMAVVINYSCHPTTIGGFFLGPDYVGYAKSFIEERIPGATAVFLQGCSTFAKPGRRNKCDPTQFDYSGGPPAAREMGEKLGHVVLDILAGQLEEIEGPIIGRLKAVDLPIIDVIQDGTPAAGPFLGPERRLVRLAKSILQSVDNKGNYNKTWPAEIQVIRIGKDFVLAGMTGEVCADIGLNIKARLAPRPSMVCGYTNRFYDRLQGSPSKLADIMLNYGFQGGFNNPEHIPSRHMIEEGNYETKIPFSPETEDFLVSQVITLCGKGSHPERMSDGGIFSKVK